MDISFLLWGLMIGLSIAAPVGPIRILCIRRTLAEGRASGLVSGLGAATADALYGSIAGFGLTFAANFWIRQQNWLPLIGGLFLCYLGLKTWWTQSSPEGPSARITASMTTQTPAYGVQWLHHLRHHHRIWTVRPVEHMLKV